MPAICHGWGCSLNLALHRQGYIRLVVYCPRHRSDRSPGHDFPHEDDGPPQLARDLAPDVEPEIEFLKVPMERYRDAQYARAEETKGNYAEEGMALVTVEFSTVWNQRTQ